ncbi:MAG: hypothetical protein MK095_09535 [Phycisphaerales bacterium]|nr:hypothetical protein [Phycisphaerales bacterium]
MTNQTSSPGLFGELSCLLICVGVIWMFFPGTVTVTDGSLSVSPDFIPLIVLVAGVVGMVIVSLSNWSKGS